MTKTAKLFWRYGSMGAGKSMALLSVAHNYERINLTTKIYTAALDNRFGTAIVASRMGISRPAETFTADTVFDIQSVGSKVACVLVDESQFLSSAQVRQLHQIAAVHGVPVICYGLRTDFKGEAFAGSAALGVLADQIEELKSICDCGRKASFNMRIGSNGQRQRDGAQIEIGGDASYRQRCAVCFYTEDVVRTTDQESALYP